MHNIFYQWWVYALDMLAVMNVEAVDTFGLTLGTIATAGLLGLVALGALAVRAPGRVYRFVSIGMVLMVAILFIAAVRLQQSWAMDMTPGIQHMLAPKGLLISNPKIKAPNYIYFSVDIRGTPRWWRVTWSQVLEKELLDRQKEAGEGGEDGNKKPQGIILQFAPSDEDREMPHFYLRPWPAQPSKGTTERPYEFAPQPTKF